MVLDGVLHAVADATLAVLGRVELHLRFDVLGGHRYAYLNRASLHSGITRLVLFLHIIIFFLFFLFFLFIH